jgi:hypothetical protein
LASKKVIKSGISFGVINEEHEEEEEEEDKEEEQQEKEEEPICCKANPHLGMGMHGPS